MQETIRDFINQKGNLMLPNYEHCVLSTITSVLKYYGVETPHKSLESLDKILYSKKYKNIVLLVLDGMGKSVLENISKDGFLSQNVVDVVTSVYPSTTTAALTTYYSGKPPYETGWIAWSQYFKEYGRPIDMLSHKDSFTKEEHNLVAKIDVFKDIVNYEPIFSRIEKASPKVKAYEITPIYSEKRSNRRISADNIDEIIESIELLDKVDFEKFIFAYCDDPDKTLHKYGTDSKEARDYLRETEIKIENMCRKLSSDTLVVISADHGHKNIVKAHTLRDHMDIYDCLYMPPYLESRCVSFWVKDNMKKEFEERFNKEFEDKYLLLTKEEFLELNMLGFGKKHKKIDDFLGNYITDSISDNMIVLENFLHDGKKVKKSTHAGITKEEMEVPVIAIY